MPRPPTDRRPLLAVLLVVALLLAACGQTGTSPISSATAGNPTSSPTAPAASASGAPSASASPDASGSAEVNAIYDAIEHQVVAIRGLQPTRPVERRFISSAELHDLLTKEFDAETPPAYLAAQETLYKALGLIPSDANLRTMILDLLGGGVAGFYRSDEGRLYVLSKSGQPGLNERFTFSHEYDHALQDQHFTVFKDQHGILDQGDRLLARQAIYEGDATLLMTKWAIANLTQAELLELINTSSDPAAAALLARSPNILKAPLVFPYTTGLAFVTTAQSTGGWPAVDAFYGRMPTSTEQILHPEKYAANEAPVAVSFAADLATRLGTGWTIPLEDTFGELQMGIWLSDGGVAKQAADAAAAGWGGDRLAVMRGPDGTWAIAMHTVWDTDKDAAAFETAATTALGKATGSAHVLPGAGGKTRWVVVANDAATLSQVSGVLGLAG